MLLDTCIEKSNILSLGYLNVFVKKWDLGRMMDFENNFREAKTVDVAFETFGGALGNGDTKEYQG